MAETGIGPFTFSPISGNGNEEHAFHFISFHWNQSIELSTHDVKWRQDLFVTQKLIGCYSLLKTLSILFNRPLNKIVLSSLSGWSCLIVTRAACKLNEFRSSIREHSGVPSHISTMILGGVTRYSITFVAGMTSLLSGAAIVHNIFLPDITIPVRIPATKADATEKKWGVPLIWSRTVLWTQL